MKDDITKKTYCRVVIHVIFSVKYRQPFIQPEWKAELFGYMGAILKEKGCYLIKINGTADHVHLLFGIKPTHSVSDLIREVKNNSSKWVNENKKPKQRFYWQNGFGAFSVSGSLIETVDRYTQNQDQRHRSDKYEEEYQAFLQSFAGGP